VGRSRTDFFSREGQQILLVAGIDQEQIILVERSEGWILLCSIWHGSIRNGFFEKRWPKERILVVHHEWIFNRVGRGTDSYAENEDRGSDSCRSVCRGTDSLRHGLKGCILEVAWVE
jgi:hypothetical protein